MSRSCASESGSTRPPTSHPQADPVVDEHWVDEAELVAGEGALRLGDDEVGPRSAGVANDIEEPGRLGPALPRDRAGLVDVVVGDDDLAAGGLDQLSGEAQLPGGGVGGGLVVVGARPQVGGEGDHEAGSSSAGSDWERRSRISRARASAASGVSRGGSATSRITAR